MSEMPIASRSNSHHLSLEDMAELSTFFDVSLDLLVIRNLDGLIVKVSPSWSTALGYTAEDLVGRPMLSLVHPDDLPGTEDSVVEVENRQAGDPVLGYVNRYRHINGHYLTLEWRAQRFGERVYGVARDVTAKIAAQLALLEAKASAETANRAKSDFLANMSHEIRTPLNGVIGIVDALSRTNLRPDQAEMVSLIKASGTTLERLVSDILDVSRIEAGKLELERVPFDLGELLTTSLETQRILAETKGLTFNVDRPLNLAGAFIGDGVRISQILGNLLSNALKFTAVGGIQVRFQLSEELGTPTLLSFEVEDTGVGFDAEHAAQLFSRFSQADASITRRFGGTGLGLSICRSLTEMMAGSISATSTPGKGSCFRVELPLPRAADQVRSMSIEPPHPDRPLRILLADDHPINQRLIQLILTDHPVDLTIVDNGEQAVAAFTVGQFDAVLMDMQMPVMDGLTATRAIRAFEARDKNITATPILMLSANAMAEHRESARAAGANLHLAKPLTARDLLSALAMALPA